MTRFAGLGSAGCIKFYHDHILDTHLAMSRIATSSIADTTCIHIATILQHLCSTTLRLDRIPHSAIPSSPGGGVAAWIASNQQPSSLLEWQRPSEESNKLAMNIASRLLSEAKAEIEDLAAAGQIASAASNVRHRLFRALRLASSVVLATFEVADTPLLSDSSSNKRDKTSSISNSLALTGPQRDSNWGACTYMHDCLRLGLSVLRQSMDAGSQNANSAIQLLEVCNTLSSVGSHPP